MSVLDGEQLNINGFCFACGPDNPHGLHMKVVYEGSQAVCRINLPEHFQGWEDIAHGGVVATMLDEIMAYAVLEFVGQGVTTGMETKYRAPVPLGEDLEVRGWVDEKKSRMAVTKAEVSLAGEGKPLAQATAKFMLRKKDRS